MPRPLNLKLAGGISAALRVVLLGGKFMLMLALARMNDPATVGVYALTVAVITVLVYVIGAELHAYTTREIVLVEGNDERSGHLQNHARFVVAAFFVCLPMAWVTLKWLNISDEVQIGLFGVVLLGEVLCQELGRYLLVLSRPVASNFLQLLRGAAWMPPAVWLMHGGNWRAIDIVLTAWACGCLLAVLFGAWHLRGFLRSRQSFTWAWLGNAMSSARHYFAVVLLTQAQTHADRFIVQNYLGVSQVGVLSFYQSFSNIVQGFVQTGVVAILMPRLLLAVQREDRPGARAIKLRMLRAALVLATFISVTLILGMPRVLGTIGHPEYHQEFALFPWLLLGNIFLIAAQVPHLQLYAQRRDRLLMRVSLVIVPLSIGANLVAVPMFGLTGAVGVFVCSAIAQVLVKTWYAHSI